MPDCLFEKRADGIGVITLNRPDQMNAITPDVSTLLAEYIADCEADPAIRCIAVTGAGRAFCSGADVKNMSRRNAAGPSDAGLLAGLDERIRDLRNRQDAVAIRLHTMAKPTIAIINGYAIGAGFALAAACDMRVMGDQARMSTGFAKIAASGDGGGTYFLTKLVNSALARELCFTAEMLTAERALELGLVNRVFAQDSLMDEALKFCAIFANGPTGAFGRMKENLNLAWSATTKEALDFEARNIVLSTLSRDHREAAQAFVEKRQPKFLGL